MKMSRRDFGRLSSGVLLGMGAGAKVAAAGESGSMAARQGQAPFYAAHLYPGSSLTLSERALRQEGEFVLALSFDDGISPANDAEIMRILAAYDAVATFFLIGRNAARHLDTVRSMVDAGHEVGNHSWSHPMMTSLSVDQQQAELRQTGDALSEIGVAPKWFRPPFGDFDSLTHQVAQTEGLESILWSVDSRDWKSGSAPDKVSQRVISGISPGAVILMHSTKSNTVAALPTILEHAKRNGYRFVTMSQWKEIMIRVDAVAVKLAVEARMADVRETKPLAIAGHLDAITR